MKTILIPVSVPQESIYTLRWTTERVATAQDTIVLFCSLDIQSDLNRLSLYQLEYTDEWKSLHEEYQELSAQLLAIIAKWFPGYQIKTVIFNDTIDPSHFSSPCVGVVSESMIFHPSTQLLFQPFVQFIFIAE
jgi:hypothetical protein